MHNKNYESGDAIKEYKSYAKDQVRLVSFDFFPGVRDFLNAALKVDREYLVQTLGNNEIRRNATGSARVLMDIISYTHSQILAQIVSNHHAIATTMNVHYLLSILYPCSNILARKQLDLILMM